MAVSQDHYRQPLPEYLPPSLVDLVEAAWHPNHAQRPAAVDLLQRLYALEPQMRTVNDDWVRRYH